MGQKCLCISISRVQLSKPWAPAVLHKSMLLPFEAPSDHAEGSGPWVGDTVDLSLRALFLCSGAVELPPADAGLEASSCPVLWEHRGPEAS